jgi:hypothetical protein
MSVIPYTLLGIMGRLLLVCEWKITVLLSPSLQELHSNWTALRDSDFVFPSKPESNKLWSTLEFGCLRCLCHVQKSTWTQLEVT